MRDDEQHIERITPIDDIEEINDFDDLEYNEDDDENLFDEEDFDETIDDSLSIDEELSDDVDLQDTTSTNDVQDKQLLNSNYDNVGDGEGRVICPQDILINVRAEIGHVLLSIDKLLALKSGDSIEFGELSSPIKLTANGKIIAEGILVNVNNRIGIKIITNNHE